MMIPQSPLDWTLLLAGGPIGRAAKVGAMAAGAALESGTRSPNAAFDPAKRDSANPLAGLAGLGVVGGATSEILRDK